jgi:hypothetical protein
MNQLPANAWWIILLFVFLIAGLPFGIWMSLRDQNMHTQINLLMKATNRMRRPWEKEDKKLKELSDRVADLKDNDMGQPPS